MLLKITAVVSLYMVNLENPEIQNSEIAANTNKISHFNLYLISNVTIKFIRVFR